MPTQSFQTIIVTGVNASMEDDMDYASEEIVQAHEYAKGLFEYDLVSELSEPGHNFQQSFCIFPCGGRVDGEAMISHQESVIAFSTWLAERSLQFVIVGWSDAGSSPSVLQSHAS